ncbi:MAG: hypothetical protein GX769_02230 [Erysipelothrix sp.]|nr:hypothetical protein [Erysipelothrix sp.]
MKKVYSVVAIGLLLLTQFRPVMAEESKLEVVPYSTAQYFWWRQDSNTYLRTEANGGWINHGNPFYASKGQSVCFTPQSTAPTIGIDISIAGEVLAGGISYTPGKNKTITRSLCDRPFSKNGNYLSQYGKMFAVYSIKQSKYYYEFGKDYYQYSKTGILKVNTIPRIRHVER